MEGCLSDILLSLDDVYVILCGGLNGRTSNRLPDTSSINYYTSSIISYGYTAYMHVETEPITRCFVDKTLNSYGKQLLNTCVALDLRIMNGVCNGDPQGRYTYISATGNSVHYYLFGNR